jgi:HSP20 family protein
MGKKEDWKMQLILNNRWADSPSRCWNDSFRGFEGLLDSVFDTARPIPRGPWVPAVDVLEKDGDLVFRVETPGLDEKDIELTLEGHVLTLKGEKKMDKEESRGDYRRVERRYGAFARSFTLPDTADAEKIRAEYRNGVLTVTVPTRPETRPRSIPVSVT